MVKSKKGTSSSKAAPAVPKCICDHPFTCTCGNRPPRPSKGHKWDPETQAWGGKGHKQKGASGQTAVVAEAAKITNVGKTKILQGQRMPSELLQEYCSRVKRKDPKSKNVANDGTYLYRIILPDNKDRDKDLIFVPAKSVENEEQAKEEACILALLYLTPDLPHERKLPEPYRTTWLNSIEDAKMNDKKKESDATKPPSQNTATGTSSSSTNTSSSTTIASSKPSSDGAQASTSLTLGKKFISNADKRRHLEELKRERDKQIRQHEAIRMANQNHPVFLAANLRKQLQNLLRGDDVDLTDLDIDEEENEQGYSAEDLDTGQASVLQRLHKEGFKRRQAIAALKAISTNTGCTNEAEWDSLYEKCLQWLCIHLDEDQLPEGFDPVGNLDVIVSNSGNKATKVTQQSNQDNQAATKMVSDLASMYGISIDEAQLVIKQAEEKNCDHESVLWKAFQAAAGAALEDVVASTSESIAALQEELETLEAIFSSEFEANQVGNATILTIKVTDDDDLKMTIKAEVDGSYPFAYPKRLLLSGSWPNSPLYGTAVHVELIKYMVTLDLGNPMMFQVHCQAKDLLHAISSRDLKPVSFLSALGGAQPMIARSKMREASTNESKPKQTVQQVPGRRRVNHRPRERSTFWSTPPKETPPARAFPDISEAIDRARRSLPAYRARQDFLSAMSKAEEGCRVMLVTGDTGCGKTTQIPQFILEEAPRDAKIVIAQPRRLAATGVASRVANERGEDQPGRGSVGYVVRGDSAMCAKSRLIFCTTGVLLRQLQCEGALENITHIVVDEVHERHLDSDVLLGFLKLRLKDYPNLRVVLMSATLDADKFASYWGSNTPRIHIPGRTFPVTDFMLEDVLEVTGYIPPKNKKKKGRKGNHQRTRNATPWNDSERSDEESEEVGMSSTPSNASAIPANHRSIPLDEILKRVDETDLDYEILGRLVCHLVQSRGAGDDGSILVFLSGAPEINNAMEAVKRIGRSLPLLVLPLHGGLQPKDQRLVFQPPRQGLTKVILSTNVAETSITIPECTVVIDSCREKQSSFDPTNRMPLLLEQFASKASLNQRRGRAGRVREGVCYKLISKNTYSKLKEHGDPEIRRCALDQTLLSLLFLGFGSDFMGKLMDPPSKEAVESALFSLRKLGAVTAGESLTPLGMHLAGIPAPPSVGKLLVMGAILGCRRAAMAMAAGMSLGRSPLLRLEPPARSRGEEDERTATADTKYQRILEERKALFAKVGNSDHSFLAAVYLSWDEAGAVGGGQKSLCESLGLGFNTMQDIKQLVNQYDGSLRAAGYAPSKDADRNIKSWSIIRACAVAALAPSQLVRLQRPTTKYDKTVEGAVERDGQAKELKFYIRGNVEEQQQYANGKTNEERVFLHPSSHNFSVGNYSCPWLVYHSMVRTSKPFLRDVSECTAYSLLLFAGDLDVQAKNDIFVIDGWVKLNAKARIGSLVGGLRQRLDNLLARKIEDPTFELVSTIEMQLITKLLVSDGHG